MATPRALLDKSALKSFSPDFYSKLIIVSILILQITRWRIFPQFMDIFYHLHSAWGFIQAGGYSGWDFWQYAPVGRVHIYPPLFHLVLSLCLKLHIHQILLAKIFEAATPVLFLFTVWYFFRKHFNERLGFFALLAACSSSSFFTNLTNHIPAALGIIFGVLSLGNVLDKKPLRATFFLILCFYTHIGISWLFGLGLLMYGAFNREDRKSCFMVFMYAILLSLPVLVKELNGMKSISSIGADLNETNRCRYKIAEYFAALWGIIIIVKAHDKKRLLFPALLLTSLIFLSYPYRFFSAEGYLPVIFLSAVCAEYIYGKFEKKGASLGAAVFFILIGIFLISPEITLDKRSGENKIGYKIAFAESAFKALLFPAQGLHESIWYPVEYISAADLIRRNSEENDILYSTLNIAGVSLASISGRATANGLFPEISSASKFDPIANSKIIVTTQDDDPVFVNVMVSRYQLKKIGENKIFVFYKNIFCDTKIQIRKASIPFSVFIFIGIIIFVAQFVI